MAHLPKEQQELIIAKGLDRYKEHTMTNFTFPITLANATTSHVKAVTALEKSAVKMLVHRGLRKLQERLEYTLEVSL